MTINASRFNALFEEHLQQFEYNKKHKEQLTQIIVERIKVRLSSGFEESTQLRKRISEMKGQLEGMEERYVLSSLTTDLYQKYALKFKEEISRLEVEFSKSSIQSSNLEKAVNKALGVGQNISGLWLSSDYNGKQKLQYLLFPEGITYSKEIGVVQTERVNSLFATIEPIQRDVEEKKKGDSKKNRLQSNEVTRIGFKPMTYCLEGNCSIQLSYRAKI